MLGGHARAAIDEASFPLLTPVEVAQRRLAGAHVGTDRPRLGRPAGQRSRRLPLCERARRAQRRRRRGATAVARVAFESMRLSLQLGYDDPLGGSPSRRRPTGSGSTRSGHPRPTARTRSRPWRGSPRRPSASTSAARSCRCRRALRPPRRRPSRRSTSSPAAASCSASDVGPAGRGGLARPGLGQAADAHPRVRRDRPHDPRREEPLEHHGEHYDIPYSGADATGLGKPLKIIIHPAAQRGADLPRGDRAEERRPHGRDRRRLAADLLLARARARRARPRARGRLCAARRHGPRAGTSRRSCRC